LVTVAYFLPGWAKDLPAFLCSGDMWPNFMLISDDFRYEGTFSQVAQNTEVMDMGN